MQRGAGSMLRTIVHLCATWLFCHASSIEKTFGARPCTLCPTWFGRPQPPVHVHGTAFTNVPHPTD
jgi:hypothetical protein